MPYHSHGLTLSTAQMKKLAKGDKIRLKNSQLSGSNQVFLLKSQLNKIAKAHSAGKGADLQFSQKQAKHNFKHGAGWRDVLKTGWDFLKPIASQVVREQVAPRVGKLASSLADKGLTKLGLGMKKKRVMKGKGWGDFVSFMKGVGDAVAPIAKPIVQDVVLPAAVGALQKRLGGAVKPRKPRAPKKMAGKGFGWGDFTGGLKSLAEGVAPIAVPLAGMALQARMGRGTKKTQKSRGKGLQPPGY